MSLLPFHQYSFDDDEINEVVDTLKSGWLTMGPKTKRFEEDFKTLIGSNHAIAVNSCSAALHLALATSDLKPGDEIITTPMTFPATINTSLHLGLKPVFADIEQDTLNIDPEKVEEKITKKTRAILPVHFAGHPCDLDRLSEMASQHKLIIIEDAAHALGAEYKGQAIGSINPTAFSFYANKNITTGEGGMLTLADEEMAEKVRTLRLQGISKDAWKRYSRSGFAHYAMEAAGYKYNMSDINASLGIHQLKKADSFLEARHTYAKIYDDAFKNIEAVEILKTKDYAKHAHHIYILAVDPEKLTIDRDEFLNRMQEAGIGMAVHYRALHLQPYFKRQHEYSLDELPIASSYSDRVLSLPLYPKMTIQDVHHVIDITLDLVNKTRH